MKTIKQIADDLGIDKQRVYRYIKKNHISEAHQKNGVMCFDTVAETAIIQGLTKNNHIDEAHQKHINEAVNDTLIDMLKTELEAKNKHIDALLLQLAEKDKQLNAAQALHAGTIKQLGTTAEGQTVEADAPDREDSASSTESRARADDIEAQKTDLANPLTEPIKKTGLPGKLFKYFGRKEKT